MLCKHCVSTIKKLICLKHIEVLALRFAFFLDCADVAAVFPLLQPQHLPLSTVTAKIV